MGELFCSRRNSLKSTSRSTIPLKTWPHTQHVVDIQLRMRIMAITRVIEGKKWRTSPYLLKLLSFKGHEVSSRSISVTKCLGKLIIVIVTVFLSGI